MAEHASTWIQLPEPTEAAIPAAVYLLAAAALAAAAPKKIIPAFSIYIMTFRMPMTFIDSC